MDKLYYTIGEVADMLGVAPSVLRFWESEFDGLHPVKNSKGNRCYTARDIDLLKRIYYLTRECGYTLDGAREQLRRRPEGDPKLEAIAHLTQVRDFLTKLKAEL